MRTEVLFAELSVENLKNMDGLAFENLCQKLLEHMHPESVVQRTDVNDFGADFVVHFGHGRRMVVQCKTAQDGKAVGVRAVQETLASKEYYLAEFACVMSNTYFTPAAIELAEKATVALIDAEELVRKFSRTIFGVEDLPFLHGRFEEAFRTSLSPFLDKFRQDPDSIFRTTRQEVLQIIRICAGKDNMPDLIDVEGDLESGIRHVMYLAACSAGR